MKDTFYIPSMFVMTSRHYTTNVIQTFKVKSDRQMQTQKFGVKHSLNLAMAAVISTSDFLILLPDASSPTTSTFSGLSYSEADDGSDGNCTESAYWADNSGIVDNRTMAISMAANTDVSISNVVSGGGFADVSAVTSGDMATDVIATRPMFGPQASRNVP